MQETSPSKPLSVSGQRQTKVPWDTLVFVCVSVAVLFARFLHPTQLLGYYQDDFFYYLKIAENIAAHGRSTFNGLQLTNGYHPLWMLVLVILCFFLHGTVLFVALQAVSLTAAVLTYLLVRRTLTTCCDSKWASAGSLAIGLASLQLMRYGMEVTLTLPLAAWFVWLLVSRGLPRNTPSAAMVGFIASLAVLSRLDFALLVMLCGVALLPSLLSRRSGIKLTVAFLLGLLPLLLLYVAVQHHVFHVLTPVSGLAKQMKSDHFPSRGTWDSLLPGDRFRRWVIAPQLILLVMGAVAWFFPSATAYAQDEETRYLRRIAGALLLFPPIHWLTLSILSDWTLWAWYFYSLTLGCVGALMLLAMTRAQSVGRYASVLYALILVSYSTAYVVSGPNSIGVLTSSAELAEFMDAHPGVWMMGDQAGTTGYLSHQPIIQTEGLVMDRDFLNVMRARTPLREVADRYHAQYYAFFGTPAADGCFHLREPSNAAWTSPHMTGIACTKPLATFYRWDTAIHVIRTADIR